MIPELFQKYKQFRFETFLLIYVLFSMVGAYNLAHLAVFSYIILLLESMADR